MILGGVNFGATFPGLYIVEKYGRRPSLIYGALWMFMWFLVFASLGHFALEGDDGMSSQGVGYAMITFACLFIAGFAMTWGPIVWAVVSEIYPSRYRAKCMAIATSSNWTWNFLISFCKSTPSLFWPFPLTLAQSHHISPPPSTIATATSSLGVVSLAQWWSTSLCVSLAAAVSRRSIPCTFLASRRGRASTGSRRLARSYQLWTTRTLRLVHGVLPRNKRRGRRNN